MNFRLVEQRIIKQTDPPIIDVVYAMQVQEEGFDTWRTVPVVKFDDLSDAEQDEIEAVMKP